jgi:hypothetical protein
MTTSELQNGSKAGFTSFKDAVSASNVVTLGDQFITADKSKLVGVQCAIVSYEFSSGKRFAGGIVTLKVITENEERFTVVDSSTGIYKQMVEHVNENGGWNDKTKQPNKIVPIHLLQGFRASTYDVNVDGKSQEATTYYLATAYKA